MLNCTYDAFIIRVFKDSNFKGYMSITSNDDLRIVNYDNESKQYDDYGAALKAALIMSKHHPEFTFDIQVLHQDAEDIHDLCCNY